MTAPLAEPASSSSQTRGHHGRWLIGLALWLALLGVGLHVRYVHATSAGTAGASPALFPSDSHLPRTVGRPTLMMFVHAECPCTRASLHELSGVLSGPATPALDAVLVVAPTLGKPWEESPAAAVARSIGGLQRFDDLEHAEALRFGAGTSGHVVLYDADGKLRFSGGVTGSRGHVGANLGSTGLRAAIHDARTEADAHQVFGCPLRDDVDAGAEGR